VLPFVDQLDRQVSATPEEFARALNAAFPGQVEGGPEDFHVVAFGAALAVHVAAMPSRRIASLVLPNLHVRMRFTAGDAQQRRTLIEYLDRATQRGGG
jgi:hypothetical protein